MKLKVISTIFLAFSVFLVSCDDIVNTIVEKVCDEGIKEIRNEYQSIIAEIQNDSELTEQEKEDQIESIVEERDEEIELFKSDCSD